eukprot:g1996.t1
MAREMEERQNVLEKNKFWRKTLSNKNYELCESYPSELYVPREITDDDLRAVAKFRSKCRIPSLVWLHPVTGVPLCRCAQPLPGLTGATSCADEKLLHAIRESTEQKKLVIVDARPQLNATGNMIMGKGYELNWRIVFLGINNIHAVRHALEATQQKIEYNDHHEEMIHKIVYGTWLEEVGSVMRGANSVVNLIRRGTAVVLHCSDGWDRTSQVSALAQLYMDGYYRTIKGFIALIEKEFLGFGHMFERRTALPLKRDIDESGEYTERSPIFLLFLDAVWQTYHQYPVYFEFNAEFLSYIGDAHYSGSLYGTFHGNCQKDRSDTRSKKSLRSCWHFLNAEQKTEQHSLSLYRNPLWVKTKAESERILIPTVSISALSFWHKLYTRFPHSDRPYRASIHSELLENALSAKIKLMEGVQQKLLTGASNEDILSLFTKSLPQQVPQSRTKSLEFLLSHSKLKTKEDDDSSSHHTESYDASNDTTEDVEDYENLRNRCSPRRQSNIFVLKNTAAEREKWLETFHVVVTPSSREEAIQSVMKKQTNGMSSRGISETARTIHRPLWQNDSEATSCANCLVTFSLFLRKHHCRACGKIFCDNCSSHRVRLDFEDAIRRLSTDSIQGTNNSQSAESKLFRVCSSCFEKYSN